MAKEVDKSGTGEAPDLETLLQGHWSYPDLKLLPYTAVRANVERQSFSTIPRTYYVDIKYRCSRCERRFVFTAEEQRYWFEELRFYVDAYPTMCPTCRQDRRLTLDAKKLYDQHIGEVGPAMDQDLALQLIEAIDLLSENGPSPKLRDRRNQLSKILKHGQ